MLEELKPKLTPDFLITLRELARCYGWSGDYVEVVDFVTFAHDEMGIKIAANDLMPYDSDETDDPTKIEIVDAVGSIEETPLPIMTFDQIVEHMLAGMDDTARASWKSVKRDQLIMGHHSTGRAIRNNYHLWKPNHPAVKTDEHPDDVSMRVMEQVWERVNA